MSSLVDAAAALSVSDERPDSFEVEKGVHVKLDKKGDGVSPVEGDTVQVNYSGRVKGKKTEFGMMRRPFISLRRRVDGVPVGVPTLLSSPSTRVMRR